MRNFAKLTFLAFLFFAASATTLSAQETEYGKASYYSDSFQGSTTASGDVYDKNKMTGAHKTLPFGTKVRVTRLDNKKSVVVTINDRGPFIKGRIVEVSSSAAKKIGLTIDGVTEVTLDILEKGGKTIAKATAPVTKGPEAYDAIVKKSNTTTAVEEKVKASKARANNTKSKVATTAKGKAATKVAPKAKAPAKDVLMAKGKAVAPKKETKEVKSTMGLRTDNNYSEYDLYRITLERPIKTGFGVQVANMTDYENTMKKVAELEGKWFKNILLSIEKGADGKPLYKIILGHYETREQANRYKQDLKKNKKINGFVVDLAGLK